MLSLFVHHLVMNVTSWSIVMPYLDLLLVFNNQPITKIRTNNAIYKTINANDAYDAVVNCL